MRRSTYSKQIYEYAVLSNCEGGGVFVDGIQTGTIKDGKFSFLSDKRSVTVKVEGGLPAKRTEDKSLGTQSVLTSILPENQNFNMRMKSWNDTVMDVYYKIYIDRSRYADCNFDKKEKVERTTYTYSNSEPCVLTPLGNSCTMNYVESSSKKTTTKKVGSYSENQLMSDMGISKCYMQYDFDVYADFEETSLGQIERSLRIPYAITLNEREWDLGGTTSKEIVVEVDNPFSFDLNPYSLVITPVSIPDNMFISYGGKDFYYKLTFDSGV